MRYYHKRKELYFNQYGVVYECDHPVYSKCTLYLIGKRGLAIIQQRYDPETKRTWWESIDPWLTDEIYLHGKFWNYFNERAKESVYGLYPTVTVRQIMWALKLKPLKKEIWETVFDKTLF